MKSSKKIIITKASRVLLLLSFFILFHSCNKNNSVVPHVYVYFQIDLNQPDMQDLLPVGGMVFVHGGHRGIIIYHRTIDEYVAYDRACTYHPYEDCRVQRADGWGILTDTCCGSEYSLLYDAIPVKGPANQALKMYRVSYNNYYQMITITNY